MESIISDVKKITKNVDGWLTDEEGEFLFNTAKKCKGKGVIVEIGSWKGKSTIWLGKGSKSGSNVEIYVIDPFTGSSEHQVNNKKIWTFDEFKKNITTSGVEDIVSPIKKTSQEARKSWNGKKIEFLWIDGAHEYEFVDLDYRLWEPLLVEGGIIAFHDTAQTDPKKVVDKYLYKGDKFKNVWFVDGITFAEKSSKVTFFSKIRNRYALFLREIYIFFGKLNLPKPIRMLGKKIVK